MFWHLLDANVGAKNPRSQKNKFISKAVIARMIGRFCIQYHKIFSSARRISFVNAIKIIDYVCFYCLCVGVWLPVSTMPIIGCRLSGGFFQFTLAERVFVLLRNEYKATQLKYIITKQHLGGGWLTPSAKLVSKRVVEIWIQKRLIDIHNTYKYMQ